MGADNQFPFCTPVLHHGDSPLRVCLPTHGLQIFWRSSVAFSCLLKFSQRAAATSLRQVSQAVLLSRVPHPHPSSPAPYGRRREKKPACRVNNQEWRSQRRYFLPSTQ